MGIDFLDIQFRTEKEFRIKLSREAFFRHYVVVDHQKGTRTKWDEASKQFPDIQVSDFVECVTQVIRDQNPGQEIDVFTRTRKQIAFALDVDESSVTPDAWLVHDLGMS
jgi:hypothetical protein